MYLVVSAFVQTKLLLFRGSIPIDLQTTAGSEDVSVRPIKSQMEKTNREIQTDGGDKGKRMSVHEKKEVKDGAINFPAASLTSASLQ